MIKRLTYKKVLVDSAYRLPQSRSSADFIIELDENMECPNGTKLFLTEVSIPAVWKTTEVGFYEKLYFMLYKNGSLFGNYIIDLSNKIYFAEQLCFDIVEKMNEATNGEQTDMFVYAYSSATRTVEIKVASGFTDTYEIKIPTDKELSTYVNGTWNRGTAEYDSNSPKSINYFLSNYVETNPIATWTSSYLNLVPFRAVFINCPELTDHHYSSPNSYSSSIVRKVIIDQQLGGVISDTSAPLYADYIDVSDKNLKRLHFRITDEKSNTLNLYDIPVQFSLIFEHPSY